MQFAPKQIQFFVTLLPSSLVAAFRYCVCYRNDSISSFSFHFIVIVIAAICSLLALAGCCCCCCSLLCHRHISAHCWGSPMFVLAKKDGGWGRLETNYHNSITQMMVTEMIKCNKRASVWRQDREMLTKTRHSISLYQIALILWLFVEFSSAAATKSKVSFARSNGVWQPATVSPSSSPRREGLSWRCSSSRGRVRVVRLRYITLL